jgi:hypothetical protein
MTEYDLELAKQAGFEIPEGDKDVIVGEFGNMYDITDQLTKFAELIRAEKQGDTNPVACMFINYDGECEEIGHLDNYNGQVPDEFTPLFTYQPDQSAEIARLERIIKDQRLLFDAREAGLEKIIREVKENT